MPGGGKRVSPGDSQYFQRAVSMSDILVDIRHNGRAIVCWQVLQG